jgi:hypothetical protein
MSFYRILPEDGQSEASSNDVRTLLWWLIRANSISWKWFLHHSNHPLAKGWFSFCKRVVTVVQKPLPTWIFSLPLVASRVTMKSGWYFIRLRHCTAAPKMPVDQLYAILTEWMMTLWRSMGSRADLEWEWTGSMMLSLQVSSPVGLASLVSSILLLGSMFSITDWECPCRGRARLFPLKLTSPHVPLTTPCPSAPFFIPFVNGDLGNVWNVCKLLGFQSPTYVRNRVPHGENTWWARGYRSTTHTQTYHDTRSKKSKRGGQLKQDHFSLIRAIVCIMVVRTYCGMWAIKLRKKSYSVNTSSTTR